MAICRYLIAGLWLVFLAYWTLTAMAAKRNIKAGGIGLGMRIFFFAAIALALQFSFFRNAARALRPHLQGGSIFAGIAGVVFCAMGIGLAIWARAHLGRNWGMPMAQKQNPDLIITGPYAVIRHPIYSGILLATLGSAIGVSLFWLLPLALGAVYFIFSARQEEKRMALLFPGQYPAYKARTKMLLPYVW